MKKFLSLLLVVMMLVSMIPATVFAADTATSSMSFASTAQRVSQDSNSQVWKNAGIVFTNNKANSSSAVGNYSNPVRIYQGSKVVITHEAGLISQIVIVSNASKYTTPLETSLKNAGVTPTVSGNNVTINFTPAVESFTFSASAQIRFNSLSVTYEIADEGACIHEGYETYEGTDGVAATCTSEGKTATVYCSNCNEPVKGQQIIPMLPHNIVDGACEDCGAEAYVLVTDVAELHAGSQIVIVATEFATTISTTQGNNNRPEAAVTKAEDGSYVSFGADAQVLTIEAGIETGTYAFNTGSGYLYAAGGTENNYMRTKAELDAAGSWTIEITEDGIATIKCADTAIAKNWLRYNDNNKIFSCYGSGQKDVAIYILPVAADPEAPCDHLGYETYEGEDYVAPTCTTTGLTATVYCSNCDAVVKEQEELPVSHEGQGTYVEGYIAPTCTEPGETGTTYCQGCDEVIAESEAIDPLGHDYEDGACNNCGEAEPSAPALTGYVQVTDVADITAGGQFVIAVNNGGTYQALGTSISGKINPTAVTVADSVVTSENPPVWEIMAVSGGIALYNGSKYLTYAGSGTNFNSSASPYAWTVEAASEGTFYITSAANTGRGLIYQAGTGNRFGGYAISNRTADGYVGALLLYKLIEEEVDPNACTHELTEVTAGYPASCTTDGKEDTLSCACGQNVQEGAVIEALGHAYDDDYCTRCNIINPEAAKQAEAIDGLPQAGDVVIFYHPKDNKAMSTAFIPGGNGGRMGAVSVTKANGMIPYSATHTAVMTVEQVGDYFRFQMNGQYLTADADGGDLSFAALPAEGETDYSLWDVTADSTYGVFIRSVNAAYTDKYGVTNYNQTIEYYQDKFYPYGFNGTDYITSYRIQIGLISRIPAVVEMDGVEYASFEEAYAYDPDTTIKLLVDFDEINVTGDLYLDLNGHTVGSVTANHIFAGDSSATAEAAGTGKLTTTSPVETTETIGSTKYVALKDENGVYTFHVLDLKLSAVTLRTNKAGIYYKAELACDEVLAEQIECYGIAVSILGMPTADFENEANTVATKLYGAPEGTFTSGSITNIFREGMSAEKNAARGEIAIYGNPYIQLKDETVLMGSNGTSKSMKDVMEYLNENFASLETAEQETVKAFYAQWADAMTAWNLENLAAAIIPTIPEEEEEQA